MSEACNCYFQNVVRKYNQNEAETCRKLVCEGQKRWRLRPGRFNIWKIRIFELYEQPDSCRGAHRQQAKPGLLPVGQWQSYQQLPQYNPERSSFSPGGTANADNSTAISPKDRHIRSAPSHRRSKPVAWFAAAYIVCTNCRGPAQGLYFLNPQAGGLKASKERRWNTPTLTGSEWDNDLNLQARAVWWLKITKRCINRRRHRRPRRSFLPIESLFLTM